MISIRNALFATALILLTAVPLQADEPTNYLLDHAWPRTPATKISEIGRGVGVIFSPDLSVEGNCRFFTALGFACFQDADWTRILDQIRNHNIFHPENRIRTLVLETHGTNGNGLKVQKSNDPKADRSYISVGALQERVEPDGVRYIIISACNSGRLLRPSIYRTLDPNPGDKLFLPATCGIINGSGSYDLRRSRVVVATPAMSHIEMTLAGQMKELAPGTRRVLEQIAKERKVKLPKQFAISDMMIQMLLRDERLKLSTRGHTEELSKKVQPATVSENLFNSFVNLLNASAAEEAKLLPVAPLVKAASGTPSKAATKPPVKAAARKPTPKGGTAGGTR